MNVVRKNPASFFYDGKIYVLGGLRYLEQSPFAEVFDTKTQSWECLPDHIAVALRPFDYGTIEIEGKLYFGRDHRYVYNAKEGEWEGHVNTSVRSPWTECVMDNVSYIFRKYGRQWTFWWRDIYGGKSKEVKGLDSFGNRYKRHGGSSDATTILGPCGGKLYVLWSWYLKRSNIPNDPVKICCAEILVEKCDGDEIWGNVEWLNVVYTASTSCHPFHCLGTSV